MDFEWQTKNGPIDPKSPWLQFKGTGQENQNSEYLNSDTIQHFTFPLSRLKNNKLTDLLLSSLRQTKT